MCEWVRTACELTINCPESLWRTTLECTYRTVGKVRRPFTPIRTLFAHYSHSRRIVFTAILTLFAHYSHGRTLFAQSHTNHYSHATVAHYSHSRRHSIRTLFAQFTHYSRRRHTKFAQCTIRTSSHPGHTIRAVGASPFALSSRSSIRKESSHL